MSTITQLLGTSNGPVASIVNRGSTTGAAAQSSVSNSISGKSVLSGALTADTLATVLSVTGRGRINFCSAASGDATSRTVRLKITLDGVSIFDSTTTATTTANSGLVGIGAVGPIHQPIDFNASLLVEVASSLSETDKITAYLNYEVWA